MHIPQSTAQVISILLSFCAYHKHAIDSILISSSRSWPWTANAIPRPSRWDFASILVIALVGSVDHAALRVIGLIIIWQAAVRAQSGLLAAQG